MEIVCKFENFEEMLDYAKTLAREDAGTQKQIDGETVKETVPEAEAPKESGNDEPEESRKEETGEEQAYTLVDVRAKLGELQKAGKRDRVKELIHSFGADRLTDVPEEKYGELMQKAGEL